MGGPSSQYGVAREEEVLWYVYLTADSHSHESAVCSESSASEYLAACFSRLVTGIVQETERSCEHEIIKTGDCL